MTDRYAVISTEKATYPVARMCEWLDVSRAGYYQWVTRPASATARRRATLATLIERIFNASGGTYGARRVTADLRTSGAGQAPAPGAGEGSGEVLAAEDLRHRRVLEDPVDGAGDDLPDAGKGRTRQEENRGRNVHPF